MIRRMVVLCLAAVLALGLTLTPGLAATEDEIGASVEAGVEWLVDQQNPDGSWGAAWLVATTGFAVVKLEDRARELGYDDPFDPDYDYSPNIIAGLAYIFTQAKEDDCGLHFTSALGYDTYETGIAMMAIAASGHMDEVVTIDSTTMTYEQVLTANVAYFANSQQGNGGWGYACEGEWSDNSNSGYAVLGLRYAESAGVPIPDNLKENLSDWIDYIQNDVDDPVQPDDGGSGYSSPDAWVNLLKTGNLLFEMEFVGDTVDAQRVQDAIDYIERHWNDPNWDPGWMGPDPSRPGPHFQAAYCLMKGLEAFNIKELEVGGSPLDWFDEMSTAIIDAQTGDGSWPSDAWGDELLGTEWALLTLEKVTPPLEVLIDIKPGSYPNSINLKSKGVIPVAILTTSTEAGEPVDFDATTVDPTTVAFGPDGAAPVHWAIEDVDCDGDMDMILHFGTQEVGLDPCDEEAVLTGETVDGDPIIGVDSVRIVPPKK